MADLKGTNVPALVVPYTENDKYATHDETFGRGGYRSVNSISEMNAIPSERRKEGMLVNVIGDKIYKLSNGSFVDAGLGNGGSGGGSSTSNVKILTTTNLIYPSRPVSLTLSEQDTNILNNLSPDDVVMAYDKLGEMELLIPISVNKFFPRITLGYLVNGLNYSINISYSSNTYVAQPPISMTSKKQDLLVSGTNIKTINGNSILGSGNIQISGGSGGGEVYVSSLKMLSIEDRSLLTQAQYDELKVIFNKWISGIPIFYSDSHNICEIACWANTTDFNGVNSFEISCMIKSRKFVCEVNPKVGNRWSCKNMIGVITIDLYGIIFADGYSDTITTESDLYLFLELKKLNDYANSSIPIQIVGVNGENGTFPISGNADAGQFYIKYYKEEYEIFLYLIDTSSIEYTITKIVNPDLSIEVKTDYNGIYYRIKEAVPNGYIQFVRKKKHKYYPSGIGQINRTGYSVLGLDFNHNSVGVNAMTLTPNVWYKFPITKERLYSKYTQGSQIEGLGGAVRHDDTIRLCGNIHANPITYTNGTSDKSRRTSVLHAGLQYNVLHPDYVNKVSPKIIFKQRGEIVPIDVRMAVDPTDFNLDPILYFAVQ